MQVVAVQMRHKWMFCSVPYYNNTHMPYSWLPYLAVATDLNIRLSHAQLDWVPFILAAQVYVLRELPFGWIMSLEVLSWHSECTDNGDLSGNTPPPPHG